MPNSKASSDAAATARVTAAPDRRLPDSVRDLSHPRIRGATRGLGEVARSSRGLHLAATATQRSPSIPAATPSPRRAARSSAPRPPHHPEEGIVPMSGRPSASGSCEAEECFRQPACAGHGTRGETKRGEYGIVIVTLGVPDARSGNSPIADMQASSARNQSAEQGGVHRRQRRSESARRPTKDFATRSPDSR